MALYVSSLIQAVATAACRSDLCDAYMVARKPCRDADRMAELLAANDAAEMRLGDEPTEPLAFGLDHFGLVVRK